MAWFVSDKASHLYDCSHCLESQREARNCGGHFAGSRYRYQIKQIKEKSDIEGAFIRECPVSYISGWTRLMWSKYQDTKIKNELGMECGEVSKVMFEAFKVFMVATQDRDEKDAKDREKKNKVNKGKGIGKHRT